MKINVIAMSVCVWYKQIYTGQVIKCIALFYGVQTEPVWGEGDDSEYFIILLCWFT